MLLVPEDTRVVDADAPERPTVGTFVEVRARPTVVRLDDRRSSWVDDFHLTAEVARHVAALDAALARPHGAGVFVIGPYGSGKSHLLAWLARRLGAQSEVLRIVAVSMLDHPASERLEDVLGRAVGVAPAADRRPGWTAAASGGLVLLVDELSEFLRSKADTRAFNEDVRFLQFLGEVALGERLVIVAAMQEQIEHTGELDVGLYRKIRDRFPVRLQLGPTHTREVLAQSVLVKRAGYEAAIGPVARRLREALPDHPVDEGLLAAIYPVHPATLELLDEVRDRFSQTRGAVDFVVTQLRGDPTRSVPPFLDQPWGAFVTPDRIVDHFYDVMSVQAEFQPLHERLFPWWERDGRALFDTVAQQELAGRLLKLLALLWLSPRRAGLTVDEAVGWLLVAATRLDPSKNRAIVARILDRLATSGRYVRRDGDRFGLDFDDDGAARLEARIARDLAALTLDDETLFGALAPWLDVLPDLPLDRWMSHEVVWHHHRRPIRLWLGNDDPPGVRGPAVVVRLPWGVSGAAAGVDTLLPERVPASVDERTALVLLRLRDEPQAGSVSDRIAQRLDELLERIRGRIRAALAQARWVEPGGTDAPSPATGAWLDPLAVRILERTYPSFARFAPTAGPVPQAGWIAFGRAAAAGRLGEAHLEGPWANLVREGYLVPMGLLRRRGAGFEPVADPGRHDLVRRLAPLLPHDPEPATVYAHLAEPVYGLVEDQVHALLAFLVFSGELEITKGTKGTKGTLLSYRDAFETMPLPSTYDRIRPTRALAGIALARLVELCEGLALAVPKQWTVTSQARAVDQVRRALEGTADELVALRLRLGAAEGAEALVEEITAFAEEVRVLAGADPVTAFTSFVEQIGPTAAFLERHARLAALPARLEQQASEVQRYRHLLAGTDVPEPPPLHDGQAVARWLLRARETYDQRAARYREDHEAFWAAMAEAPVARWTLPAVARSAQLGAPGRVVALEQLRDRARAVRCQGLVDLSFQPRCRCGFDGEAAGITPVIEAFDRERAALEAELRATFADPLTAGQVRSWLMADAARRERARGWLAGDAAWPEVDDIAAFDRMFEAPPRRIELDAVLDALPDRVWSAEELGRALQGWALSLGPGRLRLARSAELEAWCVARSLGEGTPLPRGITGEAVGALPEVSARAMARLDQLGLAPRLVVEVARSVAEGASIPPDAAPVLVAAAEVARPTRPSSPEAVAALAARLYRAHDVLHALGAPWLARLDAVAAGAGAAEPIWLVDALAGSSTWWVDGLGTALLPGLRGALERAVPGFRLEAVTFAAVGAPTTTEACRVALAEAGVAAPALKTDAVDELIHAEPRVPFDDLLRRAEAALLADGRRLAARVDPGAPLVLFADHGFRLAQDGSRWEHGGASALERWVPVVRYVPDGHLA
jgi:hypothetical protein